MTGWVRQSEATEPGLYAVVVGAGRPALATWSARDRRWYDGYRRIDPQHVRAFMRIPEFTGGRDDDK